MVAACVCPLIRLGLNRIEATPSQEGVVRGPHFCRNSLGVQRTGRVSEQLDLGERIREIPCPTLLIWATGDAISPLAVAHALAAQLRHATLVTFDTGDHWVARRFAPEVAQAIAAFVRAQVQVMAP